MENILQFAIPVVSAIATCVIGYLFNRLKKYEKNREELEKKRLEDIVNREQAINEALRALCRDRILQGYRYYKRNGGISAQDLETMQRLYYAYHNLGGNGTITAVYEKILQLPLKDGDD